MPTITTPKNFSGAFSGQMFKIEQVNPDNMTETEIIIANGDTVGFKRFCGEDKYLLNIAPYITGLFEIYPAGYLPTAFVNMAGRICRSHIRVKEKDRNGNIVGTSVLTDPVIFTAGVENNHESKIMSDAKGCVKLAMDEYDEISFVSAGEEVMAKITVKSAVGAEEIMYVGVDGIGENPDGRPYKCQYGTTTLVVDMNDVCGTLAPEQRADLKKMNLQIFQMSEGNTIIAEREYAIVPPRPEAVRMCWLNRYGTLDYYSFERCENRRISARKHSVCTTKGYMVTRSLSDEYYTVYSECEPESVMNWISGIMYSPKVWMVKDNGFIRVDVISDELRINSEEPSFLSLTMKNTNKKEYQYGI